MHTQAIHRAERVGHVHLRVADLDRALRSTATRSVGRPIFKAERFDYHQKETRMNHVTPAGNTPTLNTERLVLQPLSAHDAAVLKRISNEPPVRRYLWDDEPVTSAQIEDVVVQSVRMFSEEGVGLFGVRLCGNAELVGFCGLALNRDDFLASEASQA